jgi:hypothetical protein
MVSVDPDSNLKSASGSRKVKMARKKRKNEEISCFDVLDVLFGGLEASPVA